MEGKIKFLQEFDNEYAIMDNGTVISYKNTNKPRILNLHALKQGYLIVNMSHKNKHYTKLVHKLVMDNYGTPKPEGEYVVTHKNKDKNNNSISNLKWILRKDVNTRATAVKAVGTDDHDTIYFRTITDAARYFHSNQAIIRSYVDSNKLYKGYTFENLYKL